MAAILRNTRIFSPKNCKLFRLLATDSRLGNDGVYEDDPQFASGKTQVNILNHETDQGVFLTAYSSVGFRLADGMRVMGPCAVFPRSVLHWNVRGIQDVNEDALSLFTLLEPKIDILVLGVGERENLKKLDRKIYTYMLSKKINLEILSTDQALATFNFLNSEKRYVAGAFIPPLYIQESGEDDLIYMGSDGDPTIGREDYDYLEDDDPIKANTIPWEAKELYDKHLAKQQEMLEKERQKEQKRLEKSRLRDKSNEESKQSD